MKNERQTEKEKVVEWNRQIKEDLKKLADEKYRNFHSGLCPGTENILGVRVPVLREYAKSLQKKFPTMTCYDLDDEFYEEVMLQGMLIGLKKGEGVEEKQRALEYFISKIDNWAVCDVCVSGLKFMKKDLDTYWPFVKKYLQKEKEFEKRFAYVVILSYYINDSYIDEVLEILLSENSQQYYVYMAVAWALSVALVKYYEKTLKAMRVSKLNRITYHKALQKACESYRITKEQKDELRKLKREKYNE